MSRPPSCLRGASAAGRFGRRVGDAVLCSVFFFSFFVIAQSVIVVFKSFVTGMTLSSLRWVFVLGFIYYHE